VPETAILDLLSPREPDIADDEPGIPSGSGDQTTALVAGRNPALPDEAVAGTPLPPVADPAIIVAVLTARMDVLLRHTYRYAPPVMEVEAARAAFTPYDAAQDWRVGREHEHAARDRGASCGWLPAAPAEDDEPGWRGWCTMTLEYGRLASALLPPDHPDAQRFTARVDSRPASVPRTEPWLLGAAGERVTALYREVRRRYHAHPWFIRDRDTPAALLRVRARLARRREPGDNRQWEMASDSMAELDGVLVRCAPAWWYRVVVGRGAVPLHAIESSRAEWRARIDTPPDMALYAPGPLPPAATLTT